MTKNKLTILGFTVFALIALPLFAVEIKYTTPQKESVLGTSATILALNTENPNGATVKKPVVAKKKTVAKKKVVRKKEKLTTEPPLFTPSTAPSSPRRR